MRQLIYDGECIEFGEYNKNLYGTTFGSVLKVMAEGRIPVLNVHPSAILKLRNVTFKPLIIFVRPPDILTLKVNFFIEIHWKKLVLKGSRETSIWIIFK